MKGAPQAGVIYLSPQGYRCVLVPHDKPWFYFEYLEHKHALGYGFLLSVTNARLLSEAPRQNRDAIHGAAPR